MEDHLSEELEGVEEAGEGTTLAVEGDEPTPAEEPASDKPVEEPEAGNPAPEPTEDKPPKKKISGFERRLNRERRKTQEALAEVERLRSIVPEPTEEYEDDDDGVVDSSDPEYIKTVVAQAIQEDRRKVQEEQSQKAYAEQVRKSNLNYEAQIDKALEKYGEDFSDLLDTTPVNPDPDVQMVMKSSENAGELARHLALHQDKAQEIAAMTPAQAIHAIGLLEGTIVRTTSKPVKGKSSMTPPIDVVGTVGKSSGVKEFSDDMSDADFATAFPDLPN